MRSSPLPDLQKAEIVSAAQSEGAVTLRVRRVWGFGVRRHGSLAFQGVTAFAGYDERDGTPVPLKVGVTITSWRWGDREAVFSTQIYTGPGETEDVHYRLAFAQVIARLHLSIGETLGFWLDR